VVPPANRRTTCRALAATGGVLGRGEGYALIPSLRPCRIATIAAAARTPIDRRNHDGF
jgi:hypothetical protein